MLVGMGTVFAFLAVLVIGMSMMSMIAVRFAATTITDGANDEEIVAITAAIAQHRKTTTK